MHGHMCVFEVIIRCLKLSHSIRYKPLVYKNIYLLHSPQFNIIPPYNQTPSATYHASQTKTLRILSLNSAQLDAKASTSSQSLRQNFPFLSSIFKSRTK